VCRFLALRRVRLRSAFSLRVFILGIFSFRMETTPLSPGRQRWCWIPKRVQRHEGFLHILHTVISAHSVLLLVLKLYASSDNWKGK